MITGLLISVGVIAIGLWVSLMYVWWEKEHSKEVAMSTDQVLTYWTKCERLVRRGWYQCTMYAKGIASWGNKKMASLFFKFFPSAQPAFAKKDTLAGLSHGPSSFFLHFISESQKKGTAGKAKKIFS